MDKHIAEWFEKADMDFAVAKHLFDDFHPKPLEIICYHCQQAAEKAIKAVIVAKGAQGGLPRSHNISFLLEQIKNIVEVDEKYYEYGDTLTPYGVAMRYPNELFLDEYHAEKALSYADELIKWARKMV